ncbi:MAG TPA: DUF4157 domain-containing protein [Thermoanaerobaculia bacterium]|nr:DUF4157 domain-containing protein [Thermoanaerobaculia bacterium]
MRWAGRPLDAPLRDLLEAFFEDDLAAVRVHRGVGARLLTALLGASAVALGRRVFVSPAGARRLAARGASGVGLAAHEVVHVLQYRRHGTIAMLWRYLVDYLRGRRARLGHHASYRGIGFECAAREVGERLWELIAADGEAIGRLAAGDELPATTRRRAAELGRRLRCGPSPAPARGAGEHAGQPPDR